MSCREVPVDAEVVAAQLSEVRAGVGQLHEIEVMVLEGLEARPARTWCWGHAALLEGLLRKVREGKTCKRNSFASLSS